MKPDLCRQNGTVVAETDIFHNGAVVTIVGMPVNATPPTIMECRRTAGQSEAVVDDAHWRGLVNSNRANLAMLHDAGMVGCTAFVTYAVDFPPVDDDLTHAWMASYCPQWFPAMGKEPAHCPHDKDVGRDPPEDLP